MQRANPGIYMMVVGVSLVIGLSAAALGAAGIVQPPDEVRIDILAERYGPVLFDHALHDGYASCVECHHHVISAPPSDPVCLPCHSEGRELASVGCKACHPQNRHAQNEDEQGGRTRRYHDDIPGLIGAYHLNCISCHRAIGTGPTGCEECHEKNR